MDLDPRGPEPAGSGPFHFSRSFILIFSFTTLVVVLLGGAFLYFVRWTSLNARERIVQKLSQRFQSDVELKTFNIEVFPFPTITGQGLVLRIHGREDLPPLFELESFEARTGWAGLMANHVEEIQLHGLKITSPPKGEPGHPSLNPKGRVPKTVSIPTISRIVADGTIITRLPKDPGKRPLVWTLEKLLITEVDSQAAMKYQTTLTNAIPPGKIVAAGHFGPWNADDPGETPLDGDYNFSHANLDVFKGIGGFLSAKGMFTGVLRTIKTHGIADTPDFSLDTADHPMRLVTEYDATVDGTDGNTYLDPVKATFGQTVLIARGTIENKKGVKGKDIRLDIHSERARAEDIVHLAARAVKPVMNGNLGFTAKFFLPAGPRPVLDKLILDGTFTTSKTHFPDAQEKIDTLSRKGQGQPKNEQIVNVEAELKGDFHLRDSTMRMEHVEFHVPGSGVNVDGVYHMRTQEMAFDGHLYLDAAVSQTMTGIKSKLMKLADPLFRNPEGKGSRIPFNVNGTPDNPHLGLDMGKVFRRE